MWHVAWEGHRMACNPMPHSVTPMPHKENSRPTTTQQRACVCSSVLCEGGAMHAQEAQVPTPNSPVLHGTVVLTRHSRGDQLPFDCLLPAARGAKHQTSSGHSRRRRNPPKPTSQGLLVVARRCHTTQVGDCCYTHSVPHDTWQPQQVGCLLG